MSKEQPAAWRHRWTYGGPEWTVSDQRLGDDAIGRAWADFEEQPLYPASALDAAFRRGLERAAELIEQSQISDGSGGPRIVPRLEGNRSGLAYAAAIRALAEEPGT